MILKFKRSRLVGGLFERMVGIVKQAFYKVVGYSMQYTVYSMRYTVYSIQYTVYSIHVHLTPRWGFSVADYIK